MLSFFIGILSSTRLFQFFGPCVSFSLDFLFLQAFHASAGHYITWGSAYGGLVMCNTNMGIDGSVNWEFHLHDFIFVLSVFLVVGFIFIY